MIVLVSMILRGVVDTHMDFPPIDGFIKEDLVLVFGLVGGQGRYHIIS